MVDLGSKLRDPDMATVSEQALRDRQDQGRGYGLCRGVDKMAILDIY